MQNKQIKIKRKARTQKLENFDHSEKQEEEKKIFKYFFFYLGISHLLPGQLHSHKHFQ